MKRNETTRRQISQALNLLEERHIQEAAGYRPASKKAGRSRRGLAVACFCVVAALALFFKPAGAAVAAYAQGTDQPLTGSGAVVHTGTIDNQGVQTGKPLMFYLSGPPIKQVRFSCKNQQICFVDWTETRQEFGNAQNFTAPYGPDTDEYYYLLIDWVPNRTVQALHDPEIRIADLPPEQRQDVIVLEIQFDDGKQAVKAVTIQLTDDGEFFAAFDDYTIREADEFVRRPDAAPIPREILYGVG